jgi:hypothetical protein
MKKLRVLLGIGMALLIMAGCSNITENNNGIEGNTDTGPLAKVRIPLPPSGRSISLSDTKTITNFYEVFFTRKDTAQAVFSASATSIAGYIETEVPAGTYDILVYAGHVDSAVSSIYKFLLASAYSEGKVLVVGENTVNMTLVPLTFSLTVPATATIGEQFTVSASIDTKNPLLTITPDVFTTGGLQSTYTAVSPDPSPTTRARTYTITAPATVGNTVVGFTNYFLLNSTTSGSWRLGNYTESWATALPSYFSHFSSPISFTALTGVPQVKINLTWTTEE